MLCVCRSGMVVGLSPEPIERILTKVTHTHTHTHTSHSHPHSVIPHSLAFSFTHIHTCAPSAVKHLYGLVVSRLFRFAHTTTPKHLARSAQYEMCVCVCVCVSVCVCLCLSVCVWLW